MTPADPMATAQTSPAPAQDSQAATQPVPADPAAQPVQQATAEPAVTGAAQIAQVVNTEFPTYDKDKSGTLNQSEFGTWMVALKEKSDPSTKPDSPATKKWVDQAFASADKDKSKSLSKAELTGFLTQGA
ncbi:MAG: EF-hand domain-containing protein [Sphingomonas sp.]